jgi:hypothetical protein
MPFSAIWSKGSMVCMIGGGGSLPANMLRTKSRPDIDARTSSGVTPYSVSWTGASLMLAISVIMTNVIPSAARLRQCSTA